jgi:glycosyltransferase involved in cell wall biosynthesis
LKKNIWIWNHYATDMFKNHGGRHYWFSENLIQEGYQPTIFCASTLHNANEEMDTKGKRFLIEPLNKIPFVFIKTPPYKGNGRERILNMFTFYRNLFPVAKEYASIYGKPDIILASSVHPLTLVAGIQTAKKFGVPCICEIRDLWPETLVAYGSLKKKSLLAKLLYLGEKWIYKKADRLIFTMEGGKDYVLKTYKNKIDVSKITYINNGTDLEIFNKQKEREIFEDEDLNDENHFKVIYAGSLGEANSPMDIVQAASIIQERGYKRIKFIIFGGGILLNILKKYCLEHNLDNVRFKGRVHKKYIPYILSKSDLNIFTGKQLGLYQYGLSLNKIFDYMASGKPIISNVGCGYDNLGKYQCGSTIKGSDFKELANGIIRFYNMPKEEYDNYRENARMASLDFDFKKLTQSLIDVIESL